ncbi:hypothetical protein [Mycolicibacterium sp.]|uniref:hypothetical protein n=1 Tax=Mycolicibacterium sp. TaxID=2320850 RepID=UPI001D43A91D|nr:hypothetical protein [Mycolicibacterium sp.]MCB1290747.1 hypothetical protein [Mycobacterium sp.]MCB9408849.1 hypothetical protein [Mycolicibacterium sp.]
MSVRPSAGALPPVAAAAAALIALHLMVRAVLAFGGYFYWDDLILVGRSGTQPLLSASYLFNDHDGHVMPAAFLLGGVITRLAPLVWTWPAVSLVVLQLIASLALLRALWVILGWRPVLLVPLSFALFTPLALPAFAWWAAALNYLPMVAALAWVCADAILLVRTGNKRYALTAVLAYGAGLSFFEKSAVIPFAAFTVAALLSHVEGDRAAVRTVWRRGRPLWLAALALTAAWVALYLVVVDQQRWSWDLSMTWDLLSRSVTHGIVPGLVGGPWVWQRWAPASPWAVPPIGVMVLGWLALAAAVATSLLRKQRLGAVWLAAAGYAVACQVPIYLMRSSAFTALELAQTLRYLADLVLMLTLLAAVGICAPNRPAPHWLDASGRRTAVAASLTAGFVASSLFSTATFFTSWRDNPTKSYITNAVRGLAAARADSAAPLLDQDVDPLVLQRVVGPESLASHMFALIRDRPEFARSTPRLRMFDTAGNVVDADVTWVRRIVPGPEPQCGYFVEPGDPVRMPLDGPLLPAEWTAELNYLANTEGSLTVSLPVGPETSVAVKPGLNRVYVRLSGAGDTVVARADTAALAVCLASGPVGYLAPR